MLFMLPHRVMGKAHKVLKENKVLRVFKERLVLLAHKVRKVRRANADCKVK